METCRYPFLPMGTLDFVKVSSREEMKPSIVCVLVYFQHGSLKRMSLLSKSSKQKGFCSMQLEIKLTSLELLFPTSQVIVRGVC